MTLAILPDPKADRRKEDAQRLRDIADMVERGDISEFVFVANDVKERCFRSAISFEDRWRILGALEHAKQGIHNSGWSESNG